MRHSLQGLGWLLVSAPLLLLLPSGEAQKKQHFWLVLYGFLLQPHLGEGTDEIFQSRLMCLLYLLLVGKVERNVN